MANKLRNINRSDEHEEFVQKLAIRNHSIKKSSIFPTIKDLLCFAATLGFSEGKRVPLSSEHKKHDIQRQIFIDDGKINLIFLIALSELKDVNILRDDNEVDIIEIFEEYANGGLEIMKSWELDVPDDGNGDKAIVNGLIKNKYLSINQEEDSKTPIEF
tara:strand:- start:102 stop:578 length:477 start_codon:yes stop_codon:yes gene_type:complete